MKKPMPLPQKRAPIGGKPVLDSAATWIRQAETQKAPDKASVYTARLTIDITPALRGCIKVVAFQRGMTVADMLRAVLEREFREGEL